MHQRVNVAACEMTAAVPTSQIKISDWSGFQPANQRCLSCDIWTATFTRIYILSWQPWVEINSIVYIYNLFTEMEGNSTSVFCGVFC